MKLTVNGSIGRTYCENLCLIFFPGEKFPEGEDKSKNSAVVLLEIENGKYSSTVTLSNGEQSYVGRAQTDALETRADKVCVGKAFVEAGTKLNGKRPPWGIMTGVRPAKISNELMNKGISSSEIISVLENEYLLTKNKAELLNEVTEYEKKAFDYAKSDTCSLYVSIPFCPTRCAYCSFVSYSTPRYLSLIPDYLTALKADIKSKIESAKNDGKRIISLYIGGGTPTVLNEEELNDLLTFIEEQTKSENLLEYTVEAGRPDTVTKEKLDIMLCHGVNRTSINPQILDDGILKLIGRNHTVDDFYRVYDMAKKSGINTVNTDLIAGLPGSDRQIFKSTLDGIIALKPENVTVHTFCAKKSARFTYEANQSGDSLGIYSYDGRDTDLCVDDSQEILHANGYHPYYLYRQKNASGNLENVGFTLENHTGLYNIFIMEELHNIYAAGAGAVSKYVDRGPSIIREFNPKYTYEYLDRMNGLK